jgi:hypothetical protein
MCDRVLLPQGKHHTPDLPHLYNVSADEWFVWCAIMAVLIYSSYLNCQL